MNDISSDNAARLDAGTTEVETAVDKAKSVAAAAVAAGGQAKEIAGRAAAAAAAAPGQAKQILDDAGAAARQSGAQAAEAAQGVLDAGRRASRSVSRQVRGHPLAAVLVGAAIGYAAGVWRQR